MTRTFFAIVIALASWLAAPIAAACPPGAYGPGNGDFVVAVPVPSIAAPGQRYMFRDGRRGSTLDPDAAATCDDGAMRVRDEGGETHSWPPLPLRETETRFSSLGTQLAGRLIEPATSDAQPLVVMVHGSERTSATRSPYAYALAAQGLRVFAYDKRGTGESEGEYTQNFELLAEDAAAALDEARRLAQGRVSRAGYFGGSQGGWVAPLAATRSRADFVAVGFGLVASPIDEDRAQMIDELRAAGHGEAAFDQARRLSQATAHLLTSNFTEGFDTLSQLREEFAGEPWFDALRGEYSGDLLRTGDGDLRRVGRARFDNLELIWDYDAIAALRRLDAPLLWVLAEKDREAPIEDTRRALMALQAEGKPIDLYLFPDTDHGMVEFEAMPDGSRRVTRITDGYLRLLADWIRGDVRGSYGRGVLLRGAASEQGAR